ARYVQAAVQRAVPPDGRPITSDVIDPAGVNTRRNLVVYGSNAMNIRATLPAFGSVLLACLLMSADTFAAQRFKWWQDDVVKRKVGLTDEQTKKIEEIFMASMPDLAKSKQELDRLEQELFPFADSTTDDAALRQRIDRVETARAELNKKRTLMLVRMRRV